MTIIVVMFVEIAKVFILRIVNAAGFNNKFLPIGELAMLLFFYLPNPQLTNMAEKSGKRDLDFYTNKPAIKLTNK